MKSKLYHFLILRYITITCNLIFMILTPVVLVACSTNTKNQPVTGESASPINNTSLASPTDSSNEPSREISSLPQIDISAITYFPVQLKQFENDPYPLALVEGIIVFDKGCLRLLRTYNPEATLLIWPAGFSLQTDNNQILIVNSDKGIKLRIGETVKVGGGETSLEIIEKYTGNSVPKNINGPYFLVGKVIK